MTWADVAGLAATQHGLVTTRQLHELGVTRASLRRAIDGGRVAQFRRGVYLFAGVPRTPWLPLAAALLTVDGVASHRAAAGLHGFPGVVPGAVEITVFDATSPRLSGVVTHRGLVLHADDVLVEGPLPHTSPARTLIDMAGQADVSTSLLRRMLDDCAVRRLCTPEDVDRAFGRCGTHRHGSARLRRLVAERVQADSHLEQLWLRRLIRAGLRPPALGYQLVVDSAVIVLDFAWPSHRVGVEVDGWRPHATRSAFDRDRFRDLAAARLGWRVLRITSRTPPSDLFRTLRQVVSQ